MPRGRRVEPASVRREPERRPEVGGVDVFAGVPPGGRWDDLRKTCLGDRHVRSPARREQPLVAGSDDEVGVYPLERKPPAGLCRIDQRHCTVGAGRGRDRGDVGDLSGRHLDRAEGNDVDGLVDRLGECRGRHEPHRDASVLVNEEREERRRELDVRHENVRPGGKRRCDEPYEPGHRRPDRHRGRLEPDQPRERRASRLGRLAPVLPARAAGAPVVERRLHLVPGGPRRQAEAGGVEVRPRGLPQVMGVADRERHQGIVARRSGRCGRRISFRRSPP